MCNEVKKNKELQDGIEKMSIEITHRDELLSKVSESLKNKQFNDSVQNEDIIKENNRLKLQLRDTEENIEQLKKETEKLKHNDLMLKSKINELTSNNHELKDFLKNNQDKFIDEDSNLKIQKLQNQNKEYLENLENCISDLKKLKQTTLKKELIIKDISSKLEVS